jgi:hypothetical protein
MTTVRDATAGEHAEAAPSVGHLRGAGVDVDVRRVGQIGGGLLLAALLVVAIVLTVAGAKKNAQIDHLHHDGVAVQARVTSCLGLLGGSGSNAAGYACEATFNLRGHRYTEAVPGTTLRSPGSLVQLVVDRNDPGLVDTPEALATERSSARVFVFPAVIVGVLAVVGGGLVGRGRQRRRRRPNEVPPET